MGISDLKSFATGADVTLRDDNWILLPVTFISPPYNMVDPTVDQEDTREVDMSALLV